MDIRGENEEDRKIWYTYHKQALIAARKAVEHDENLNVRSAADESLSMWNNSLDEKFMDSLVAIVLNIFVVEYRINRVGKVCNIWDHCFSNYIDENGGTTRRCKKFSDLSLYQKWRNLPKFLKKKETERYTALTEHLNKFIHIRNDIAHAKYDKIRENISPKNALDCYNTVTEVMIELNVILGRQDEEKAKEILGKLLL